MRRGLRAEGLPALVLEQHDKPGGYATAFRRPGGFPEITAVGFVPHTHLYRAVFPEHDVRVQQRDVPGYADMLVRLFPEEKAGIEARGGKEFRGRASARACPASRCFSA